MIPAVESVQREVVLHVTESLVVGVVEIEASLRFECWIFERGGLKAGAVAVGQLRGHIGAATACCISWWSWCSKAIAQVNRGVGKRYVGTVANGITAVWRTLGPVAFAGETSKRVYPTK